MTDIYEVIQTASDQHVRTLLRLLCDSDFNIKSRASEFHGMIQTLQPGSTVLATNGDSFSSVLLDRKRKRDPMEIFYCVNCKECFVDEENDEQACSYHPGEFEADYDDFFADHDEEIHGKIDDEEMFEQFPQGYLMTCCGDKGDTVGCYTGQHVGGNRKLKPTEANGAEDSEAEEEGDDGDADAGEEEDGEEEGEKDKDDGNKD